MGRQHQGMDRPGVRQVPNGSGEQGKIEETGCKIICGAQTTLAVKRLMIMMMNGFPALTIASSELSRPQELSLSLSLSLTHTHTRAHTHTRTHTHTHTHTQSQREKHPGKNVRHSAGYAPSVSLPLGITHTSRMAVTALTTPQLLPRPKE